MGVAWRIVECFSVKPVGSNSVKPDIKANLKDRPAGRSKSLD
jgi:hypothetical protein